MESKQWVNTEYICNVLLNDRYNEQVLLVTIMVIVEYEYEYEYDYEYEYTV